MKKILLLIICILCMQQLHAISCIAIQKIEPISQQSTANSKINNCVVFEKNRITNVDKVIISNKKRQSFWAKCKSKITSIFSDGDDESFDIFALLSFCFLLAAIVIFIIAFASFVSVFGNNNNTSNTAANAINLLLFGLLLLAGSLVTSIIGTIRYLKNPDTFKGKGFLLFSLIYWFLALSSFLASL